MALMQESDDEVLLVLREGEQQSASSSSSHTRNSHSAATVDTATATEEEEDSDSSTLLTRLISLTSEKGASSPSSSSSPSPSSSSPSLSKMIWVGMINAASRTPQAYSIIQQQRQQREGNSSESDPTDHQENHHQSSPSQRPPVRYMGKKSAIKHPRLTPRVRALRQQQQQKQRGNEEAEQQLKKKRQYQQQEKTDSAVDQHDNDHQKQKKKRKKKTSRPPPASSLLDSLSSGGFGVWSKIHPADIPNMSYEGYLTLAVESLDSATRAAIAASEPYVSIYDDCYHHDPWPVIRGEIQSPIELWRRLDHVYGREEYCVCASRPIADKTVVAFLAGRLMEQSKGSKEQQLDQEQHFFMDRAYLQQFFNYQGEHSLIISTKHHKNIANYISDPCERTDGEDANIKVDVVLDPIGEVFFLVLYAAKDIAKSEELYCLPFLGRFLSRAHRQMFLHARISHWYHRWVTLLEQQLIDHHVAFDSSIPVTVEPQQLSVEQEEKHYGDGDARAAVYQVSMDEGLIPYDLQQALNVAHCTYSPTAFLAADMREEVKELMQKIPNHLPKQLTIQGRAYAVDQASLLTIITEGHDHEMIEVREDLCIASPIRYFDVPCRSSFCVCAKRMIPCGTFVFIYGGEISEAVKNYGSTYIYNLPAADIKRLVPRYTAPDLHLDAMLHGNISRFVNDNRYRLTEDADPGSSSNIDCTFLYYNGMLHLAFFTTRHIETGDELISQYGDEYWKSINSRVIDDHKEYYNYISLYSKKLETLLKQQHLPLPDKPDYTVETYRLFHHKPSPYPPLLLDSDTHTPTLASPLPTDSNHPPTSASATSPASMDETPRYEVEKVLAHLPAAATAPAAAREYLVAWVGYDGNTWEKAENMDGCAKVLDSYWQLRKVERLRNGRLQHPQHQSIKSSSRPASSSVIKVDNVSLSVDSPSASAKRSKKKQKRHR